MNSIPNIPKRGIFLGGNTATGEISIAWRGHVTVVAPDAWRRDTFLTTVLLSHWRSEIGIITTPEILDTVVSFRENIMGQRVHVVRSGDKKLDEQTLKYLIDGAQGFTLLFLQESQDSLRRISDTLKYLFPLLKAKKRTVGLWVFQDCTETFKRLGSFLRGNLDDGQLLVLTDKREKIMFQGVMMEPLIQGHEVRGLRHNEGYADDLVWVEPEDINKSREECSSFVIEPLGKTSKVQPLAWNTIHQIKNKIPTRTLS